MLLFDPAPPDLHWCRVISDEYIKGICRLDSDWNEQLEKEIPDIDMVKILPPSFIMEEKFQQNCHQVRFPFRLPTG